jgi:4-hydroxy-3-polyprenylbenzoate decarboxylase
MPAFYNQPQTIDDLVNQSVGRVLDLFDLDVGILKRWDGLNSRSDKPSENEEPDESETPHKVFGIK